MKVGEGFGVDPWRNVLLSRGSGTVYLQWTIVRAWMEVEIGGLEFGGKIGRGWIFVDIAVVTVEQPQKRGHFWHRDAYLVGIGKVHFDRP